MSWLIIICCAIFIIVGMEELVYLLIRGYNKAFERYKKRVPNASFYDYDTFYVTCFTIVMVGCVGIAITLTVMSEIKQ